MQDAYVQKIKAGFHGCYLIFILFLCYLQCFKQSMSVSKSLHIWIKIESWILILSEFKDLSIFFILYYIWLVRWQRGDIEGIYFCITFGQYGGIEVTLEVYISVLHLVSTVAQRWHWRYIFRLRAHVKPLFLSCPSVCILSFPFDNLSFLKPTAFKLHRMVAIIQ